MNDRLMSTGNVAEVLDISEATVKRWADAGTLPCIRTPGGHRKFRLRDIAMHLASPRSPTDKGAPATVGNDCSVDDVVSALLVGDTDRILRSIAMLRLHRVSMASIVDTILQPAFDHVKQACDSGRCEAFHLHVAINSLIEVSILQKPNARGVRRTRGYIVTAPLPGEVSDIGARFGSLVAGEGGFDTQVLGVGLLPPSVSRAADDLGASWVLLVGNAECTEALVDYAKQVLAGIARSQAKVLCVGVRGRPTVDMVDGVFLMSEFRDAEALLAPAVHRGNR